MRFLSTALLIGFFLSGQLINAQTILFDGSNLDHFEQLGETNWTISGDIVEGTGGSGHLVTKESYTDFLLTLEFWVDDPANSGVFIRCQDPEMISPNNCYEVNIFDQRPDQTYRTGGIVYFAAPAAHIDAAERWNTYEIRAQGNQLLITLNDVITVDMDDDTYSSGPLTLQYGNGIIRFRNVQIERL
ncbi:MAG: hypothetical protein CMM56_06505 [Rhodospirillaceae bacterium]|nr:hypothetical protein [Rhodospirillaceae bacterium]|tara:strand:- start:1694 stop:2254 length:561 start_codon:yes stop_codon:yes gene_type:complete